MEYEERKSQRKEARTDFWIKWTNELISSFKSFQLSFLLNMPQKYSNWYTFLNPGLLGYINQVIP